MFEKPIEFTEIDKQLVFSKYSSLLGVTSYIYIYKKYYIYIHICWKLTIQCVYTYIYIYQQYEL